MGNERVRRKIELLSPARDAETATAAILSGADAVYMGAERFGARENAGNSLEDIAKAAEFAHQFGAKLYVALNTILSDSELDDAVKLSKELDDAKVDALIVQDMGLLARNDMPPLPLHASTQCHIASPGKALFLAKSGKFETLVLARELSLNEIRDISNAVPECGIECFVHGALCVSFSGQCHLSAAIGGRSGNRGNCAQPCREFYSLFDSKGRKLAEGRLLSLKDMNRSASVGEMLDAGVSSFKIEGRLKDSGYVKNITAHYRKILDEEMSKRGLVRSSFGESRTAFVPSPEKSFNRGFCDCGLHDSTLPRRPGRAAFDTPKSRGEFLGIARNPFKGGFFLESKYSAPKISNGDGLLFVSKNESFGGVVNGMEGKKIFLGSRDRSKLRIPKDGWEVWRNFDFVFEKSLELPAERRIGVEISLSKIEENKLEIRMTADTPRRESSSAFLENFELAKNQSPEHISESLKKLGSTIFFSKYPVKIQSPVPFLKASEINGIRRELAESLRMKILENAERDRSESKKIRAKKNSELLERQNLSEKILREIPKDMQANVSNSRAEKFYASCGIKIEERSLEFEKEPNYSGRKVMSTRHCILRELGACKRNVDKPLRLVSENASLLLKIDCKNCGMEIFFEGRRKKAPSPV